MYVCRPNWVLTLIVSVSGNCLFFTWHQLALINNTIFEFSHYIIFNSDQYRACFKPILSFIEVM